MPKKILPRKRVCAGSQIDRRPESRFVVETPPAQPVPTLMGQNGVARVPDPAPSPELKFDADGRIIPFSPEERATRLAAVERMIEELKNIHNGPDEDDRDFFRAMDAERPGSPLFEGLY